MSLYLTPDQAARARAAVRPPPPAPLVPPPPGLPGVPGWSPFPQPQNVLRGSVRAGAPREPLRPTPFSPLNELLQRSGTGPLPDASAFSLAGARVPQRFDPLSPARAVAQTGLAGLSVLEQGAQFFNPLTRAQDLGVVIGQALGGTGTREDIPGWVRGPAEVIGDPLNLFGVGFGERAATAVAPHVPGLIRPLVRAVGAADVAFTRAGDVPIQAVAAAGRAVSPAVGRAAVRVGVPAAGRRFARAVGTLPSVAGAQEGLEQTLPIWERLNTALRGALERRRSGEVSRQIRAGRAEQFGSFKETLAGQRALGTGPEEALRAARASMGGALTTVPPIPHTAADRTEAFQDIIRLADVPAASGGLHPGEAASAVEALTVALDGLRELQPGEITLLRRVGGEEFARLVQDWAPAVRRGVDPEVARAAQGAAAGARLRQAEQAAEQTGALGAARGGLRAALTNVRDISYANVRGIEERMAVLRQQVASPTALGGSEYAEAAAELDLLSAGMARFEREEMEAVFQVQRQVARERLLPQQRLARRALDRALGHDRALPNDEQLLMAARRLLGEERYRASALSQPTLRVLEEWIKDNRRLLDAVSADGAVWRDLYGSFTGATSNAYVSGLLRQRAFLVRALEESGVDQRVAQQVGGRMMDTELVRRFGVGAVQVGKEAGTTLPPAVQKALREAGGVPYEQSIAGVGAAVQALKAVAFAFDLSIFGLQGLAAVTLGSPLLMAGAANRLLSAWGHPLVQRELLEQGLARRARYALDGVMQGAASAVFDPRTSTSAFRWFGPPGRVIDQGWSRGANALQQFQFGTVLGGLRNLSYEGALTILHLAGSDITDITVRRSAAQWANVITSAAPTALRGRRRQAEEALLTSPSMTRAMVDAVRKTARALDPRPGAVSREERILAAMTISSLALSTLMAGTVINDQFGIGEFEWDPSKPGFGFITLPGGTRIDLFPMSGFRETVARSFRALAELDFQEAATAWARFSLGRASFAGQVIGGAAGAGFDPQRGLVLQGLSGTARLLNVAPVPPLIEDIVTEGFDPVRTALNFFGVSSYPERATAEAERLLGKPWAEASPAERDAFGRENPTLAGRIREEATRYPSGQVTAWADQRIREEAAKITGPQDLPAFRDAVNDVALGARSIRRYLGLDGGEPRTTRQQDLNAYFTAWDVANETPLTEGQQVRDVVEALHGQLRAGIGEERWAAVLEDIYAVTDPNAPDALRDLEALRLDLTETGFWVIRDRVWEMFAGAEFTVAGRPLASWPSLDAYRRWVADGVRQVYERATEADIQAQIGRALRDDPLLKQVAEAITVEENGWVNSNPELADRAVMWGYFRPTAPQRGLIKEPINAMP